MLDNGPFAGQRVAGEINCNLDPDFEHPDKVFVRNHAPKRTVLGIIGKDGCMSEYINLPVENLHRVSNLV
jgi:threonine dehydrogenase-like Zn-dependent dehydrogenase